ncbi:MAG: PQQ-dependent sugar dehydrogenase [Parafilimonas sp.]|nr:PQQ-dependent sugar dehydrogenase [Parafilimonas sp.]
MKKQSTLLILLLASSFILHAQQLKLVKFSSGYSHPVGVENCGDSRLFIVEQEGKIFIADSAGNKTNKPFLDITDRVLYDGGEQGLLGLAFDPNYAANGFFYLNYINKSGNTQISRFKVKPDNANLGNKNSEKFILEIDQPFANHNGGCIRFGADGYLYIGMGDGGSGGDPNNNSQNKKSLLGKMLRIDVHHGDPYGIPKSNPFVDSSNYKPEIWDLGLRNPWRWSFDALNGALYIADVGQDSWEEVDVELQEAGGKNYGWRCYEGKHAYNTSGCLPQKNYVFPKYEYPHSDSTGDCSVTGGFVYRGTRYSDFYGKYVFTDYCSGLFRLLYTQGGQSRVRTVYNGDDNAYSSFGVDKDGEIYVCNLANGNIYHVTYGAAQLETVLTTGNTELNKLSFSPNPSNGNVNITYTSAKAEQVSVRITNIMGTQVYADSRSVNAGINTWNANLRIPGGNYYLSVLSASGNVITQSLRIE